MSKPVKIKIFNVGHANAVYIEYEHNKGILFDCGEKKDNTDTHDDSKKAIKALCPTAVIISHPHDDHNNMFSDLDKMYNTNSLELLVRKKRDGSIYDRLSYDLLNNKAGKTIIETDTAPAVDLLIRKGYDDTFIYMGEGKIPDKNDKDKFGLMSYDNTENDTGFILVIKGNKTVILSADVSYYSWPEDVKNEIDNANVIVLPHHGGGVYTEDITDTYSTNNNADLYISSTYDDVRDSSGTDRMNNIQYDIKHKTYLDKRFGNSNNVNSTKSVKKCFEISL